MLVLSRKKNEAIVINDDITIVVVEIRGDKVRLGVEAPKEVPVHRREVFVEERTLGNVAQALLAFYVGRVPAEDCQLSARRVKVTQDHFDQSRLPRPVRAQQTKHATFGDADVHVLNGLHLLPSPEVFEDLGNSSAFNDRAVAVCVHAPACF